MSLGAGSAFLTVLYSFSFILLIIVNMIRSRYIACENSKCIAPLGNIDFSFIQGDYMALGGFDVVEKSRCALTGM